MAAMKSNVFGSDLVEALPFAWANPHLGREAVDEASMIDFRLPKSSRSVHYIWFLAWRR